MRRTDDKDDVQPTEDFASMLAEFEKERPPQKQQRGGPRVGDVVRAPVVSIGADAIFLDLGAKAEGQISLAEVRDPKTGQLTVAVGDVIEAHVVSTQDGIILRRVLGRGGPAGAAPAELAQAFEHGVPVEGLVTGVNKGGVEVQIAGQRAFCPISQLDARHVEDAQVFVGQRLQFRITKLELDRRGANIVLSRRALLEEEAQSKAAELRERLVPGAVLSGRVTTLKDYGAFVDLGGIEGMLHVSELGFQRVAHPKDLLTIGQPVEVQVLRIEKSDDPRRPERVALSLKSLEKDPWLDAKERFPEGAKVRGRVMRVESFGAFIELAPGVEGLAHISELGANRQVRHARELVKPGDELEVLVLAVDAEKRRLSLSVSGLKAREEEEDARESRSAGQAPARLGTLGDLLRGVTAKGGAPSEKADKAGGKGKDAKKK